jgi:hypothetical protein|tara:strand:- start:334 stop:513 length:180 start_codon:yes stop_codon:yes gene_type:complete
MKSKLSDNAKNKSWKHREFWNSLPDVVHSDDVKSDYVDLFRKLNPIDPKTGHPKEDEDE